MLKQSLLLAFLIACKTDGPTPAVTGGSEQPAAPSGTKARSGKIDLGPPSLPRASEREPADPTTDRAERRKARMAALDKDGDGVISDEEREAARDVRQKSLLERFDTDKDGTISEAERTAMRRERAEDMRKRFDRNNDGTVTPEELAGSRFGRSASDLDADHDGNISTDELDAAMKRRGGRERWNRDPATAE